MFWLLVFIPAWTSAIVRTSPETSILTGNKVSSSSGDVRQTPAFDEEVEEEERPRSSSKPGRQDRSWPRPLRPQQPVPGQKSSIGSPLVEEEAPPAPAPPAPAAPRCLQGRADRWDRLRSGPAVWLGGHHEGGARREERLLLPSAREESRRRCGSGAPRRRPGRAPAARRQLGFSEAFLFFSVRNKSILPTYLKCEMFCFSSQILTVHSVNQKEKQVFFFCFLNLAL